MTAVSLGLRGVYWSSAVHQGPRMTQTELAGRLPGVERPIPVQSIVASWIVDGSWRVVRLRCGFLYVLKAPARCIRARKNTPRPVIGWGGFSGAFLGFKKILYYSCLPSAAEQRNDRSRNRPSWGPGRYLRAGLAGQKPPHWALERRGRLMAPKAPGKICQFWTRL